MSTEWWSEPKVWQWAIRSRMADVKEIVSSDPKAIWVQSPDGLTLLHAAAKGSLGDPNKAKPEFCKWLVDQGLEVNAQAADGRTPLMEASAWGNLGVVSYLLSAGARADLLDAENRSAAHHAAMNGYEPIFELLQTKWDVREHPDKSGIRPLQYLHATTLATRIQENNRNAVMALLASEPELLDMNICLLHKSILDLYPIHVAVKFGSLEMIRSILSIRNDINLYSRYGYAPIHCAVLRKDPSIVSALLDLGADPRLPSRGTFQGKPSTYTALHLAAESGNVEIMSALVRNGADVNAESHAGVSLQSAIQWAPNKLATIKFLVEHGADVNYRDKICGQSILKWAKSSGCEKEILDLLIKAGAKDPEEEAAKSKTHCSSNAPSFWPKVDLGLGKALGESDLTTVVAAQLMAGFKKSGDGVEILGVNERLLFPEGILHIGIRLLEKGVERWVCVYPEVNSLACAHFAGLQEAAKDMGKGEPVFYAAKPILSAKPASPFRPFRANAFEVRPKAQPTGEWAMWWKADSKKPVAESACIQAMDRAYRALAPVASYAWGNLAGEWGLSTDQEARILLPEEELQLVLVGPEHRGVLLSASREKGLRLRFLISSTPPAYRDTLWELFADYAEQIRREVEQKRAALDSEAQAPFLAWWEAQLALLKKPHPKLGTPECLGWAKY